MDTGRKKKASKTKQPKGLGPLPSKVFDVVLTDAAIKEYEIKCQPSFADEAQVPTTAKISLKRKRPVGGTLPKGSKKDNEDSDSDMESEDYIQRETAKGNDVTLVNFQPIERIDVNVPGAKERVFEARCSGVPIVLIGHRGWPQFAARWLKGVNPNESLDLTNTNELDLESMVHDIGDEEIPIVQKNYNEQNPIENTMKAADFLIEAWPQMNSPGRKRKLYLQQWQFPNSETAAKLLAGPDSCKPLPNGILSEDLLPYWLNRGGNPYQYLFMGDCGTRSKLHKDPGGLEILIAPIIGVKECILVHRQDGNRYLYDLQSRLDKINLNEFPMTAFARIWKTDVKPGEILLMPYDTYHQCRNITPCLSYHRLHLDVVNLRGFLESMHRGDAMELEHSEVIWNTCHELMVRVEDFVEKHRARKSSWIAEPQKEKCAKVIAANELVTKTVDALRLLRVACLDFFKSFFSEKTRNLPKYRSADWENLIFEIDRTLHAFSHKDILKVPRYRPQSLKLRIDGNDIMERHLNNLKKDVEYKGNWKLDEYFEEKLTAMNDLPALGSEDADMVISDKVALRSGDEVLLRFNKRVAKGEIIRVRYQMKAVLLSYADLPASFDEYKPLSDVRGQSGAPKSAIPTALKPALDINNSRESVRSIPSDMDGKLRAATVLSSKNATFYYVKIALGNCDIHRWLRRTVFIRKHEKLDHS